MYLPAIDTVGGIPAHPLLVHIPVMMIPLALALTLLALVKRVRTVALWGATGSAVIGLLGCFLATSSGEALQHAVNRSELLHEHIEAGDQVAMFTAPFVVILIVVLLIQLARTGTFNIATRVPALKKVTAGALTALLGLSVALGALAAWKTYDAGHSGAKSAWNDVDVSKVTEGDDD